MLDPFSMLGLEAARALLLQGTGWTLFVLSLSLCAYLYRDRNKIIAERLKDNERNIKALERVAASNGTVAISVEQQNKVMGDFATLLSNSVIQHKAVEDFNKDSLRDILRLLRGESQHKDSAMVPETRMLVQGDGTLG